MLSIAFIAEQLRELNLRSPSIVLEPVAKNTAPAVAAAALLVQRTDPKGLMLVMPADSAVPDIEAFLKRRSRWVAGRRRRSLVLFGIAPDSPATGYDSIQTGPPLYGEACRVSAFVEKPNLATADSYLAGGRYLWNSGIFLARECGDGRTGASGAGSAHRGSQGVGGGEDRLGLPTVGSGGIIQVMSMASTSY